MLVLLQQRNMLLLCSSLSVRLQSSSPSRQLVAPPPARASPTRHLGTPAHPVRSRDPARLPLNSSCRPSRRYLDSSSTLCVLPLPGVPIFIVVPCDFLLSCNSSFLVVANCRPFSPSLVLALLLLSSILCSAATHEGLSGPSVGCVCRVLRSAGRPTPAS